MAFADDDPIKTDQGDLPDGQNWLMDRKRAKISAVVLAKAPAHNHRILLLGELVDPSAQQHPLGVMGPGFRQDDSGVYSRAPE